MNIVKTITKKIKDDEIIILSALNKILNDKRIVTAGVGLITVMLTTSDQSLAAYEPIIMVGLFAIVGLIVHGYTLSDVYGAGSTLPGSVSQGVQGLIGALQANTNATANNTSASAPQAAAAQGVQNLVTALQANTDATKNNTVASAAQASGITITADPTTGPAPLKVVFSVPDVQGTVYSWYFDDETAGSGASVSHTFATNRDYTVRLIRSDSTGNTVSSVTIAAQAQAQPVAHG